MKVWSSTNFPRSVTADIDLSATSISSSFSYDGFCSAALSIALCSDVNLLNSSVIPYCHVNFSGGRHAFLKLTRSGCFNARDDSEPHDSQWYSIFFFVFCFLSFLFSATFCSTSKDSGSLYLFFPCAFSQLFPFVFSFLLMLFLTRSTTFYSTVS